MSGLPKGWRHARFGDLFDCRLGKMLDRQKNTGAPRRYLRNANVRWRSFDLSDVGTIRIEDKELDAVSVRTGDLVICEGGEPGRCAVWHTEEPFVIQKALHRARPKDGVDSHFYAYHLTLDCLTRQLDDLFTGTTIKHLTGKKLVEHVVVLPPLEEQQRIVCQLDSQLSRSGRAKGALADILKLLDQFRQCILAAAFRGDLTEEWREEHAKKLEPSTALLRRIRGERRVRWQGRGAYQEPVAVNIDDLPKLPEAWAWASLREIAALKGGITKGNKRTGRATTRPVPYLRVANVQRGYLKLNEVHSIEATEDEINDLRLLPGDVLFNEGGDRDKLGRGWVWQGQIEECIHQNHVFRARLYEAEWDSRLVSHWGNAFGQKYFQDEGKQTTNLASISLSKLGDFPVPVIPLAEQKVLIGVISKKLDAIDRLAEIVGTLTDDITTLESSILAKAFRGELVAKARE